MLFGCTIILASGYLYQDAGIVMARLSELARILLRSGRQDVRSTGVVWLAKVTSIEHGSTSEKFGVSYMVSSLTLMVLSGLTRMVVAR